MKKAFALAATATLLFTLTACTAAPKEDIAGCDSAWNDYISMLNYYPKAAIRDGSLTRSQAVTYLAALQVYSLKVTAAAKTVKSKDLRNSLNGLAASVSAMKDDFQQYPLNADKQIIADFTATQDAVDVICKGIGWKTTNFGK